MNKQKLKNQIRTATSQTKKNKNVSGGNIEGTKNEVENKRNIKSLFEDKSTDRGYEKQFNKYFGIITYEEFEKKLPETAIEDAYKLQYDLLKEAQKDLSFSTKTSADLDSDDIASRVHFTIEVHWIFIYFIF